MYPLVLQLALFIKETHLYMVKTNNFMHLLLYKQLLDEGFVISRIIKVSVRVISLSLRLRLISLTSTLNEKKKGFCFFTDDKQHKAQYHDCVICSYDVTSADQISKIRCRLSANQKRVRECIIILMLLH